MINVKSWMNPSFYYDQDWNVRCTFLTADGKRHDIKCHWNFSQQAYTFRFRGEIWKTNCTRG